jgi:hypothetical protein
MGDESKTTPHTESIEEIRREKVLGGVLTDDPRTPTCLPRLSDSISGRILPIESG